MRLHRLMKQGLLATVLGLALVSGAWAQALILAVNEGVTYQSKPMGERYRPLVSLLESELKRPVQVQAVDKYADFAKGLQEGRYALVFIHPAHLGLAAVKSGKYAGLATAKGYTDYRARIMVTRESTLRSIQDLQGRKVGVPSLESITTALFMADLRALGMAQPERYLTATRYQDAVPFMVEKGFVEAGVTGSERVAREWQAKGGRILAETQPVAIKQFLVSRQLADAERSRLQSLLLNLEHDARGRAALQTIGLAGFVPWNATAMEAATLKLGL